MAAAEHLNPEQFKGTRSLSEFGFHVHDALGEDGHFPRSYLADIEYWKGRKTKEPEVHDIHPTAELHTMQEVVSGSRVLSVGTEHPDTFPGTGYKEGHSEPSRYPTIIKRENRMWVLDGHHRLTRARVEGKSIPSQVWDMDKDG